MKRSTATATVIVFFLNVILAALIYKYKLDGIVYFSMLILWFLVFGFIWLAVKEFTK